MNMLSPDGQCYSFDRRGTGYGRGEGFGILVLKRVSDALRDGDTIRAVIRNSSCNQDGNTPGITQPNSKSQEALIRETYLNAGLSMFPARFFEAHGTGTAIGDPTEANALGAAFSKTRTVQDPLVVGAVKSNIGHLEGCSGIASVIKTILVLETGIIPPNTNFEQLNPKIDTEYLKIKVSTAGSPSSSVAVLLIKSAVSLRAARMALSRSASCFSQLIWIRWNKCCTFTPRWPVHGLESLIHFHSTQF